MTDQCVQIRNERVLKICVARVLNSDKEGENYRGLFEALDQYYPRMPQ
jgi:hypothetical protein